MSVEQENTSQSMPEDDLPDWLKEIRGQPEASSSNVSDDESDEITEAFVEAEEAADNSLPDWLKETQAEEQLTNIVDETVPDVAVDVVESVPADQGVADAAEDEDEADDWQRLLAEEGIQMDNLDEDRPDGAENMSLRDWLAETSSESPLADSKSSTFSGNDIEEASTEVAPEPIAEQAEDTSPPSDEQPDWLTDEDTPEPETPSWLTDEATVEPEAPSWLSDETDLEAASVADTADTMAESAVADDTEADDLPDWLREDVSTEDDTVAPSWLSDEATMDETAIDMTDTSPLEDTVTTAEAITNDDGIVAEDDLPDWLREDGDSSSAVEAPSWLVDETTSDDSLETLEASTPEVSENIPADEKPEEDIASVVASTDDDGIIVEDELPDWLREDAVSDIEAEAPSWLTDESVEPASASEVAVPSSDEAVGDVVADDDIPDWLSESDDADVTLAGEDIVSEEGSATADDVLPDWLREPEGGADSVASLNEAEGTRSDGMADVTDDAMIDSDGLPDWLRDDQVDLGTDIVASDDEDAPDWLTDVSEDVASSIDDDVELDDVPDWLKEGVEQEDEAEAEEAVTSFATDTQPETPSEPEGESAETQEVKVETVVSDQHVLDKLSVAKGTLDSGELDEALSVYQDLIADEQALDQVIADLVDQLPQFEGQPTIYEVLGDAYMRNGDLGRSLESYQQALANL